MVLHTRMCQYSTNNSLSIDHITEHSSDVPYHHLMGVREVEV